MRIRMVADGRVLEGTALELARFRGHLTALEVSVAESFSNPWS